MFHIFLVQHDNRWKEYYKEIEATITDLLTDYSVKRISHNKKVPILGIFLDVPGVIRTRGLSLRRILLLFFCMQVWYNNKTVWGKAHSEKKRKAGTQ
ncbi:MAG: hypothetical protein J6U63_07305 [Clostridia bacterium]|nr:hypothetical protein [Clostridia bacterium]